MQRTLYIKKGSSYTRWNAGSACFFPDYRFDYTRANIAITCRIGDINGTAMLDTGAQYSMIGLSEANDINLPLVESIDELTINTRHGNFTGKLYRNNLVFLSEDPGDDLEVEAPIWVSPEWDGMPIVIGFKGLLEHMRIALDSINGINMFYFGKA